MEVIEEINIDIDPIMPMSTVVENYLQPTPPTTCVEPSRTWQRMYAQARKKKIPIAKTMKNIVLLLPICAIASIGQEEVYATAIVGPKKAITTKSMPTTWKKNTFVLLPTCVIIITSTSSVDYATTLATSSLLVWVNRKIEWCSLIFLKFNVYHFIMFWTL